MSDGFTITVIVGATSFVMQDNGYYLTGEEGTGASPSRRQETRGAQQHGSTDRGFFLRARFFGLTFSAQGANYPGYKSVRGQFNRLFKPTRAMSLLWTYTDGDLRQIDCVPINSPDFPSNRRSGYADNIPIEFKAAQPWFYDPGQQQITFALGGGSGAFDIPLAIPWSIGASALSQTKTIAYGGTWRSNPVITIVGPATDAVLENLTTDEKLDFTGVTINAGDQYVIDTRYGFKTVTDLAGNNKLSDLTGDSDLGSFHIEEPDGNTLTKDNDLQFTATAVTAATEVFVRYYVNFTGI